MSKPCLYCSDVDAIVPVKCCLSCHSEMDEGYTNNFDDCDEDSRVDQEFCCAVETQWKLMTDEQRKAVVERKLTSLDW
jgi:hypothetical protein